MILVELLSNSFYSLPCIVRQWNMAIFLVFKMFWLSQHMRFPWESNIKVVNLFGETIINLILFTSLCPETIKYACPSGFYNVLIVSAYDISMRIKCKSLKSFWWNYYQSHLIHFLVILNNKIWVSFVFLKCSDCLNIWNFPENQR